MNKRVQIALLSVPGGARAANQARGRRASRQVRLSFSRIYLPPNSVSNPPAHSVWLSVCSRKSSLRQPAASCPALSSPRCVRQRCAGLPDGAFTSARVTAHPFCFDGLCFDGILSRSQVVEFLEAFRHVLSTKKAQKLAPKDLLVRADGFLHRFCTTSLARCFDACSPLRSPFSLTLTLSLSLTHSLSFFLSLYLSLSRRHVPKAQSAQEAVAATANPDKIADVLAALLLTLLDMQEETKVRPGHPIHACFLILYRNLLSH
jgi:hypothetical protein